MKVDIKVSGSWESCERQLKEVFGENLNKFEFDISGHINRALVELENQKNKKEEAIEAGIKMMKAGSKIDAVKEVRNILGLALKDAKDFVELHCGLTDVEKIMDRFKGDREELVERGWEKVDNFTYRHPDFPGYEIQEFYNDKRCIKLP